MCWSPIRTIRIQLSEEHIQERQSPTKGMFKLIKHRDVSKYVHFHLLFLFTKITLQKSAHWALFYNTSVYPKPGGPI